MIARVEKILSQKPLVVNPRVIKMGDAIKVVSLDNGQTRDYKINQANRNKIASSQRRRKLLDLKRTQEQTFCPRRIWTLTD